MEISPDAPGFTNLVYSYSTFSTVAGAGGATGSGVNKWSPSFEGGPATSALLSRPHIAMADRAGNIYIADKDAHGIRKVRPDGTIVTVAGINSAGNGPDAATPGTQVALNEPNGLFVLSNGTVSYSRPAEWKNPPAGHQRHPDDRGYAGRPDCLRTRALGQRG